MRKSAFGFGLAMLVLGLGAGGAVGYLLAPSAPVAPARDSGAPAAGPAARDGGAASADAGPGASAAGPAARGAGAGPAAAAATGDGVITGTVAGPDGEPLAGVLVRAEPLFDEAGNAEAEAPHLPPGSPPPETSIAEEVRAYERGIERERAGRRDTESDATGAFALRGLPAKQYRLQAWLVGWRIERAGGKEWEGVPVGGRCAFKARRLHALAVSVVLPDGKAPANATIEWTPTGEGQGGS